MHPSILIHSLAKSCVNNLTQLLRDEFLLCYSLTKTGKLPQGSRLVTSYVRTSPRKKEPFTVLGDNLVSKIDKVMLAKFDTLSMAHPQNVSEMLSLAVAEFNKPDHSHYAEVISQCEQVELSKSRLIRCEVARQTLKIFQARL